MSGSLPPPDPMWTTHIALLVLQVSLLVLTAGIFVTTMISAYESLSLMRRTLTDIIRISRDLEERLADLDPPRRDEGSSRTRSVPC